MTLSKGWFSLSSDGVGVVVGVIRDLLMAYDQVKIKNRSRMIQCVDMCRYV